MRLKTLLLITILFNSMVSLRAQAPIGFWKVSSVKVSDRVMTPVARWFKFKADGNYESGNGWTKNSYGIWTYNEEKRELESIEKLGVKDEFGAFKVQIIDDTMSWKREEEGMMVKVTLVRIEEMPMAPADQIKGLWQLVSVTQGEAKLNDYDPESQQYLHVRPDRVYRMRNPDGSMVRGIWHMNGHRPIFTLINRNKEIEDLVFTVRLQDNKLIMKERKEEGKTFQYQRMSAFPE